MPQAQYSTSLSPRYPRIGKAQPGATVFTASRENRCRPPATTPPSLLDAAMITGATVKRWVRPKECTGHHANSTIDPTWFDLHDLVTPPAWLVTGLTFLDPKCSASGEGISTSHGKIPILLATTQTRCLPTLRSPGGWTPAWAHHRTFLQLSLPRRLPCLGDVA